MPTLSPIESEFVSTEDAVAHDHWVRAKVAASLADSEVCIPHQDVMAELEAIIQDAELRLRPET